MSSRIFRHEITITILFRKVDTAATWAYLSFAYWQGFGMQDFAEFSTRAQLGGNGVLGNFNPNPNNHVMPSLLL